MKAELIRLNVDVPRELHKRAKRRALDDDTDLRSVVIAAIEAYLAKKKVPHA
jgi:hypothetical protein